ncbi:MAG: hypothetical protein MO852_05975, partial [Candidatus Devosia euplotis]|nr:hypothetical protein [Candidatus Devosia euplotis]
SIPSLAILIAAIVATEAPSGMTTRIVGIDGCGGAGKSTLDARLAGPLGAKVVHTDDFASWNNLLGWYGRLIEQVLEPLARNVAGRYQRYDWAAGSLAEWHDVATGGVVIVEGVSATRAFRPMLRYKIFVDAPQPTRLARGLARDGAQAIDLWTTWQKAEDAYLASENPANFADVVLDGTRPLP